MLSLRRQYTCARAEEGTSNLGAILAVLLKGLGAIWVLFRVGQGVLREILESLGRSGECHSYELVTA